MEYMQKQRAAMMEESKMASYGAVGSDYGASIRGQAATLSSPSLNMKSSPVDVDLDGIERELNVLIDNLSTLKHRLDPVLCAGFSFEESPGEPARQGSPISHRLNVFRTCIIEANNRIQALKNGLEI